MDSTIGSAIDIKSGNTGFSFIKVSFIISCCPPSLICSFVLNSYPDLSASSYFIYTPLRTLSIVIKQKSPRSISAARRKDDESGKIHTKNFQCVFYRRISQLSRKFLFPQSSSLSDCIIHTVLHCHDFLDWNTFKYRHLHYSPFPFRMLHRIRKTRDLSNVRRNLHLPFQASAQTFSVLLR